MVTDNLNVAAPTREVEISEPLPLEVVPDWNEQLQKAEEACRLIDRHLDFEARGRMPRDLRDFRPAHLCPEQRVQMMTDLSGTV
jgi:hypothetical protein